MFELHKPIVRAPDFAPGTWINSAPLHIDTLRGSVVLADIWDFACISCIIYAFTFTSCVAPGLQDAR